MGPGRRFARKADRGPEHEQEKGLPYSIITDRR